MKKLFFVAVATLGGVFTVNAQSIHPRVEVAGNFAKIIEKANNTEVKNGIKPGVRVGAAVEIPIGESGVYVAPGLTYKMEGTKNTKSVEAAGSKTEFSSTTSLHYLTIPVDLGMRVDLGAVAISVEAGPYFSYALKGTSEGKAASDILKGAINATTNLFEKDQEKMKRYDVGIGASAAVEYSRFYFRLGTDFGLINTAHKNWADKINTKNASFYAGVGFRF